MDQKLEKFLGEVVENRNANKFREATKDLLVHSGQIVLTLTVNPSSRDLMVTGESTLINLIESVGLENLSLADIKTELLNIKAQRDANKSNDKLLFCELHRDVKKDYSENQPVAILPTLNHLKPDEWGVIQGRKVVGTYYTEIKARNNNKYDRSIDKKASWLPKGIDKIYNSTLTRDECTSVMKAIMKEFPETNPEYDGQRTKKEPNHYKKVIHKIRNMFSDNTDEEGNASNIKVAGNQNFRKSVNYHKPLPQREASKDIEASIRRKTSRLETAAIRCNSQQVNESSKSNCNTSLDSTTETEMTTDSDSSYSESEPQREQPARSCKKSMNEDISIISKNKHYMSTDDSDESRFTRSFSTPMRSKKMAKKSRTQLEHSNDADITNSDYNRLYPDLKENFSNNSYTSRDNNRMVNMSIEDDLESEEETKVITTNKDKKEIKKLSRKTNYNEKRLTDLRNTIDMIKSNATRETRECVPKRCEPMQEKSHRIKENGKEHSDLRKKLFLGKAMALQPRGGWENWLEQKKGQDCSC